jgi:hypothetical protein
VDSAKKLDNLKARPRLAWDKRVAWPRVKYQSDAGSLSKTAHYSDTKINGAGTTFYAEVLCCLRNTVR